MALYGTVNPVGWTLDENPVRSEKPLRAVVDHDSFRLVSCPYCNHADTISSLTLALQRREQTMMDS